MHSTGKFINLSIPGFIGSVVISMLALVFSVSGQQVEPCFGDHEFTLETAERLLISSNNETISSALIRIKNCRSADISRTAVIALKNTDPTIRAMAASSVIWLPADEAVSNLMPLLKDPSDFVRREASYALGKTNSTLPVPALIAILRGKEDAEVHSAAIIALGEIGSTEAVAPLVQILQQRPREEDEFIRRSAARAIGQIAEKLRFDQTEPASPHSFLPADQKPLRTNEKALTEVFPYFKNALTVLINSLTNIAESADTRREAVFALGAIGDRSAIPLIEKLANDSDPFVSETSREALQRLGVDD